MQNILQCAVAGAATIVGKHREFIAVMKKKIPGLIAIQCVIHRKYLVARNLSAKLHNSLHIMIKCINKIKAHSLNDRLFAYFVTTTKKILNVFYYIPQYDGFQKVLV